LTALAGKGRLAQIESLLLAQELPLMPLTLLPLLLLLLLLFASCC